MNRRTLHILRERTLNDPRWLVEQVVKRVRRSGTFCRAWIHRRVSSHVTYIGITGTAGKTTTKDLTAAIFSTIAPCQSTERTENEPFYVAQTIVSAGRQHRFCVVEVAASERYDLATPAHLLKPDIAVLTVVAREHYSGFRSLQAIAAEKEKLIKAIRAGGTAVLNIDDPLVRAIGERCARRVVWFGEAEGATVRLREASSLFPEPLQLKIEHQGKLFTVRTQLHGTQLAIPVLAALGVAVAAGVRLEQAIEALAAAPPAEGRMQIVAGNDGVVFVRDDWKAAHWSMQPPLDFLKLARAQRKVVVIGSVSDSPDGPSKRYARLARRALDVADLVLFVGLDAIAALKARPGVHAHRLQAFAEIRDAAEFLRQELRAGDLVLLKGTNTNDHLVRLVLNRARPIECWRAGCRLTDFCGGCSQLYRPVDTRAHTERPRRSSETTLSR